LVHGSSLVSAAACWEMIHELLVSLLKMSINKSCKI
jgi:hypothetical protein